jgi:hypothetical protein
MLLRSSNCSIQISSPMKSRKPCTEIHENGNSKNALFLKYFTLFNGDSASGRLDLSKAEKDG